VLFQTTVYSDSLLALDPIGRRVVVAGHEIELEAGEFDLLAALVSAPGEAVACETETAESLRRKIDAAGTAVMPLERAGDTCRYLARVGY
jgi:DNA-binding response OmpR family regulator